MQYNQIANQNIVADNIADHIHATEITVEVEIEIIHANQGIITINSQIVVIQDPILDPHHAEIVIIHIITIIINIIPIIPIHILAIVVIVVIPINPDPRIIVIVVDQIIPIVVAPDPIHATQVIPTDQIPVIVIHHVIVVIVDVVNPETHQTADVIAVD